MRRFLALLLLAAALCTLTGCELWVKDDYLSVKNHVEQELPNEEPPAVTPPVVTNRTELRGTVLSFIRNWTESGSIVVRSYPGDISADLSETMRYATEEDPIGAYAVDYADAQFQGEGGNGSIALSIVFRRSAAEIDAIVTVNGDRAACQKLEQALSNFDTALTLRIRNYAETDFAAYIREFCLLHPEKSFLLPQFSAEVYPQEGETRILELHFLYPVAREELRLMQNSVNTILSSASAFVRKGKTSDERAALLFRFLTERFQYTVTTEEPAAPVYSLLCQGVAHSRSFSSVFYAEGAATGLDCLMVTGTLDGQPYHWNMLRTGDGYFHVDLMRAVTRGETELTLLTDEDLSEAGYVWDTAAYPQAVLPEPPPDETDPPSEPAASTEPEPTEESTEPSSQPDESSDPPEPSGEGAG